MPKANNNLAFLRDGNLTPNEITDLRRLRGHPAFERLSDPDKLGPFRKHSGLVRKHGADSGPAQDSHERLILANMRLVFKIAKFYAGRGVPVADLVQEGFFGLDMAVRKFKPELGFQFSTYASWWVRSIIARAVRENCGFRALHIPMHHYEFDLQVQREVARFTALYGEMPNDADLLAFVAESGRTLNRSSRKRLRLVREMPNFGLSLSTDAPFGPDDQRTLGSKLEANSFSPETLSLARIRKVELERQISVVISTIGKPKDLRNNDIVRMRYGIGYPEPKTLQEIGTAYHITREAVRQIVFRRLKSHNHTEPSFKLLVENLQTIREALEASR